MKVAYFFIITGPPNGSLIEYHLHSVLPINKNNSFSLSSLDLSELKKSQPLRLRFFYKLCLRNWLCRKIMPNGPFVTSALPLRPRVYTSIGSHRPFKCTRLIDFWKVTSYVIYQCYLSTILDKFNLIFAKVITRVIHLLSCLGLRAHAR